MQKTINERIVISIYKIGVISLHLTDEQYKNWLNEINSYTSIREYEKAINDKYIWAVS